jgi:uncharacterized membrane protein YfcA
MISDHTTLSVLAVLFLATVIRSALGFGEALVAVPLLALVIPVGVAAPVAVLVSATVAGVILVRDWRAVHAAGAGRLILSTLCGIPLGLLLLIAVPEPLVKTILGSVIIAFAVFRMAGRGPAELKDDRLAWIFGFGAGVLGGAYGMNGPPLVAYAAMRRWSPERFRATLQGYFLPASSIGMAGYWMAGLWVADVTRYYVLSLPVVLTAIALGGWLNRRLHKDRFLLCVHAALIVIGLVLLIQAAHLWVRRDPRGLAGHDVQRAGGVGRAAPFPAAPLALMSFMASDFAASSLAFSRETEAGFVEGWSAAPPQPVRSAARSAVLTPRYQYRIGVSSSSPAPMPPACTPACGV